MLKHVSKPKIRQKCFEKRKEPFGRIVRSKVHNLTRVFIYLHDSNSNFRPAGIDPELVSDRTVRGVAKGH